MLIVCPSCKTKFSFDDKKVGAVGVKLRCSKCHAIFRVIRKTPLAGAPADIGEAPPVPPS
ncbi:MAG TPA: zinc-ribbon domain-containing protein, partial [Geobacteraceae bacterium]|nr:zinc-ribbon domain-containing protein [Geobacteraceae bacterium]